jgi:CRP-like cAMP-binding protein
MLSKQLSDLEERFCEMSTQSAPLRVAHEIARLVNRIGMRVNNVIRLQLSREDLAQLTGTTLFTVSRLLSQWKKLGVVTVGREFVMVHDVRALADLAELE